MFRKKRAFDDEKKSRFVEAISTTLAVQLVVMTGQSLEDKAGNLNRKAIGYIYGFVDCALRHFGQDMSDVSVGLPILFQVLRHLFPGNEQAYTSFLIEHQDDEAVMLGIMTGGQQYADFVRPSGKGTVPMGLARFILEGEQHEQH